MADTSSTFQGRRTFIELSEETFRELSLQPPAMTHDVDLPLALTLEIENVPFSVVHASDISPNRMLVECTFGQLPAERRIDILTSLLYANQRLLQLGEGTFGYDAETGNVLYILAQPLHGMRAASLLEKMTSVAHYARHWQGTFFLDDALNTDYVDPIEVNKEELNLYRYQMESLTDEIGRQLETHWNTEIEEDRQRITKHLRLEETQFSLSHLEQKSSLLTLSYYGDQVQEESKEEALSEFLQLDLELAYSGDPVFCLDEASGKAIFACCGQIKNQTTPLMIAKMSHMFDQAMQLCNRNEEESLPEQTTQTGLQTPPAMLA